MATFASQKIPKDSRRQFVVFVMFLVFMAVAALTGGSSREDAPTVIFVRGAAVLLLIGICLVAGRRLFEDERPVIFCTAAIVLLVAFHLVPLPPSIWTNLPGRDLMVVGAEVADIAQPWRPLSIMPGATLNALVSLAVPVAVILAVRSLGPQGRARMVGLLLILIILSGLLAMLQVAGGPDSPLRFYPITNEYSGVGLFANRNHHAVFMATGLPLTAYFISRHGRAAHPWMVWAGATAMALFLLASIWVSGSRAGLAIAMAAALLAAIPFYRELFASGRMAFAALGGAALSLIVLTSLGLSQGRSLARLIGSDPMEDMRVALVGDFLQMVRGYFPVGSGYGTFPTAYREHERPEMLSPEYLNHAHNDLLEVIINGGLVPILLIMLFLYWYILCFRRAAGERKANPDRFHRDFALLVSILLLLLASVVDYPLRAPLLSSVFAVMCGLLVRTSRHSTRV